MNNSQAIEIANKYGYKAQITETLKNGVWMTGLEVQKDDLDFGPVFYNFSDWSESELLQNIEDAFEDAPDLSKEQLLDIPKEYILENCFVCANAITDDTYSHESDRLCIKDDRKHIDYVIKFYIPKCDHCTITMTNNLLDAYDISSEDIWLHAKENTRRRAVVKDMFDMIQELAGDLELPDEMRGADDSQRMFVVTNENNSLGGGIINDETFFQNFCESHGFEKIFILPSSIHEILIVPCYENVNREELDEMVHSVNETQVAPQDFLADRAFTYSAVQGCFID